MESEGDGLGYLEPVSLHACHAKKILGGTNGIDLRTTGDYFGFHELEQRTTILII